VSPSTEPAPAALTYATIATQPVRSDIQGIALYVHHVAYVEDGTRLVLMDWRTGARRTVLRAVYGSLSLLATSGRYATVVDHREGPAGDDPAAPRRDLGLDLVTGATSPVRLPVGDTVVGSLNDARIEVDRPRHEDLSEPWRANLVLVDQQPDPDVPRRPVTTNGLVVEAAFDGKHQVVWTQRKRHSDADPGSVWTLDLFRPELGARRVTARGGVPYSPVIGDGFVGWVEDGMRLRLAPVAGGPVLRVPGHLGWGTEPSADRQLVAFVARDHGVSTLQVIRVEVP